MLFNFEEFIEELRENEEKKHIVEKYESLKKKKIEGGIFVQDWYVEYASQFDCLFLEDEDLILVPSLWKDDFDWTLLIQLVLASFSSNVKFIKSKQKRKFECLISVDNEGNTIAKLLHELYPFQIDRLYQIYSEEQINFQNHLLQSREEIKKPDGDKFIIAEEEEILEQRKFRYKHWKYMKNEIRKQLLIEKSSDEIRDILGE